MTQEQLLDHVFELLRTEATKKPGVILLVFDEGWKALYVEAHISPEAKIITAYDTTRINAGLPPSEWIKLSKQLWAVESVKTDKKDTIKFPTPKGKTHGKSPGDTDDGGGRKPA